MVNAFYIYAVLDPFLGLRALKKRLANDSHRFQMAKQRFIFFTAVRVFLLYELTEYCSMHYLISQT